MNRPGAAAAAPARNTLVTLMTDFGLTDPFVGLVKARILAACPAVRIVDLSHAIPPFAVEVASFWVERCSGDFPPGSLHVCIVDPGVGTARRILVLECRGQTFLAPDNGLLARLARQPGATVRALDESFLRNAGLAGGSATFHGRDIFAPVAGMLAAGEVATADLGGIVDDWAREDWTGPSVGPHGVRGRVVLVDHFGNLFSNIEAQALVNCPAAEVRLGGRALPLVRTYGDRPSGSLVALVNAFGVIEAACVGGSAAETIGVGPGAAFEVSCRRN